MPRVRNPGGSGNSFFGQTLTPPVLANFTTQVAPATLTGFQQGIYLADAQNAADKLCSVYLTTTPATPYAFRTLVSVACPIEAGFPGIFFGWSDGTKYEALFWFLGSTGTSVGWHIFDYSNSTTFAAAPANAASGVSSGATTGFAWLKIADDGTNVHYYYGPDGANWIALYSVAKSAGYLGTSGYSRISLGCDFNNGGVTGQVTYLDFTQTAS